MVCHDTLPWLISFSLGVVTRDDVFGDLRAKYFGIPKGKASLCMDQTEEKPAYLTRLSRPRIASKSKFLSRGSGDGWQRQRCAWSAPALPRELLCSFRHWSGRTQHRSGSPRNRGVHCYEQRFLPSFDRRDSGTRFVSISQHFPGVAVTDTADDQQEPEPRFLERRLQELEKNDWAAVEIAGCQTTRGVGQLKHKENGTMKFMMLVIPAVYQWQEEAGPELHPIRRRSRRWGGSTRSSARCSRSPI